MTIVTDPNGTMCSQCYRLVPKGGKMLEGQGGTLYCSPDCFMVADEEFEDEQALVDNNIDEGDYEE
jgi:hypothetical protein